MRLPDGDGFSLKKVMYRDAIRYRGGGSVTKRILTANKLAVVSKSNVVGILPLIREEAHIPMLRLRPNPALPMWQYVGISSARAREGGRE